MMNKTSLTLEEAKHQFLILINSINDTEKEDLISFIYKELVYSNSTNDCFENDSNKYDEKSKEVLNDPITTLNTIANDIKKRLPINAIFSSENIVSPTNGENADCLPHLTVHVDEFLYDEEEVEELVENDKLKRNYCKDCGSKNIKPLIFTSHSLSKDALYFIFNTLLPVLANKTVLDVGSRLGSVLYGAYVFTDAPHIIGVEMNEDLYKLQNDIVCRYNMKDRIEIFHKRIQEAGDIVKSADVIIINNSFEFYVSEWEHIQIWQFLKHHIKSKTILITRPHLETILKNINSDIILSDWVKPYNLEWKDINSSYIKEDVHYDIAFYEII